MSESIFIGCCASMSFLINLVYLQDAVRKDRVGLSFTMTALCAAIGVLAAWGFSL